jgi:hypothetical protein
MALGRLTEAEYLFQDSIAAFQKTHTTTLSVHPYSYLGILYVNIDQLDRAREYLCRALEIGVEINSVMAQIPALGGISLFLAQQGKLEYALEIYALMNRYPWMGNARNNKDIIEPSLTSLTASLTPEVIAAAQKRGRERDLGETVQELLAELR